jgi:hypothetical protein
VAELEHNETAIRNPNSVGPYTAKFEFRFFFLSSREYCVYMVPGKIHQEHHNCNQ